jgi:lysozyme family protein
MRFNECLEIALRVRDNFDLPRQSSLNHGITQVVYSLWREEHRLSDQDVYHILPEEIEVIYQCEYWIPSHAAECPAPLDFLVFDCAIRSGAKRAIQLLQQALERIPSDGVFGHETHRAIEACDGYAAANRLMELRQAFEQKPEFATFCRDRISSKRAVHFARLLDEVVAPA